MEFLSTDTRAFLIGLAGSTAQSAGRLVLVLIIGFVTARVLRALINQLEHVLVAAGERTGARPGVTRARVATLTSVLRTLALVSLWSVVAVICLSQLGFDVRPILAGAASSASRWASARNTSCATSSPGSSSCWRIKSGSATWRWSTAPAASSRP